MDTDAPTAVDNIRGSVEPRAQSAWAKVEPQLQNARERLPDRSQVQGILAWLAVGATVLTIGGVTFTGGAIFLAFAIPIFIVLSPVLVPVGGVLLLVAAIVVTVAALGVAAFSAAVWLYKYFKGEEPVYYDRVDAARTRIASTANDVKTWARDHVSQVQAAPSA